MLWLFLAAGTLMACLGVPLMRRRVPPNALYGLRVLATRADERVWYDANAAHGRDLVVLGGATAALALALTARLVPGSDAYAGTMTAWLVAGVLVVWTVGTRRARRLLADRHADR